MSERGGAPLGTSQFREVLSQFATGVLVLTVGGEQIHGMTANAFTSVSLDPPLVLCCVARDAAMHDAVTINGRFALSIMGADQEHLARYFADKRRPFGRQQFDGLDWAPGKLTNAPLLADSVAWLECELSETHVSGDHSIFVALVLSASLGPNRTGLLFFDGQYDRADPSTITAP